MAITKLNINDLCVAFNSWGDHSTIEIQSENRFEFHEFDNREDAIQFFVQFVSEEPN